MTLLTPASVTAIVTLTRTVVASLFACTPILYVVPDLDRNNSFCEHKDLWIVNYVDIISAILLYVISALAASSGTGGGKLFDDRC